MKTLYTNKFVKVIYGLALFGFLTGAVHAIPITGTIDIGPLSSTVTIDKTANTVTFIDSVGDPIAGSNAIVLNATDDLAGSLLDLVQYEDFTYDPLSVSNPIWYTVTGTSLAFSLTSITFISEAGNGLVLAGLGTLAATGYDVTDGFWSFSADSATNATAGFTFSSQTAVPEPSSLMLLGLTLLGLGLISRSRV